MLLSLSHSKKISSVLLIFLIPLALESNAAAGGSKSKPKGNLPINAASEPIEEFGLMDKSMDEPEGDALSGDEQPVLEQMVVEPKRVKKSSIFSCFNVGRSKSSASCDNSRGEDPELRKLRVNIAKVESEWKISQSRSKGKLIGYTSDDVAAAKSNAILKWQLARLQKLKKAGIELRLILGRKNNDKRHQPLPKDPHVEWVYLADQETDKIGKDDPIQLTMGYHDLQTNPEALAAMINEKTFSMIATEPSSKPPLVDENTIPQLHRMLKPGGAIYISDPSFKENYQPDSVPMTSKLPRLEDVEKGSGPAIKSGKNPIQYPFALVK
jgi:hypothetical protein